jgi:hypothetical protein
LVVVVVVVVVLEKPLEVGEQQQVEVEGMVKHVEVVHVPHSLANVAWMYYFQPLPIFAVFECAPSLPTICGVHLLPHPVGAAVDPAAYFSLSYACVASTSHHAVELHPWQPGYLYAVAVAEEDHVTHL